MFPRRWEACWQEAQTKRTIHFWHFYLCAVRLHHLLISAPMRMLMSQQTRRHVRRVQYGCQKFLEVVAAACTGIAQTIECSRECISRHIG